MLDKQFEIDWVSSFTSMGRQLKKKKKKTERNQMASKNFRSWPGCERCWIRKSLIKYWTDTVFIWLSQGGKAFIFNSD